jgi:hypothetical protein
MRHCTNSESRGMGGGGGRRSIHLARRASFCEVWWIPSPILDARLLNSERAEVAVIEPSRGPALPLPLLLLDATATEEEGTAWRRALLTAERKSLVRSRNDTCEARVGFMAAGRAAVDLRPGSGSRPSPSTSVGRVGGGWGGARRRGRRGGRRGSAQSVDSLGTAPRRWRGRWRR